GGPTLLFRYRRPCRSRRWRSPPRSIQELSERLHQRSLLGDVPLSCCGGIVQQPRRDLRQLSARRGAKHDLSGAGEAWPYLEAITVERRPGLKVAHTHRDRIASIRSP